MTIFFSFLKPRKDVKEKFRKQLDDYFSDLKRDRRTGPTKGKGAELGKEWHAILHEYLTKSNPGDRVRKMGESVIEAVTENLPGIEFLQSKFPLYGYMTDKEKSDVSLWNGEADAIGWYDDNYVIVDWKVVDILDFWGGKRVEYLDYLHQCLVYARLLMLHLNLSRLPYILIVPISSVTGYQINPGIFYDYPNECKEKLNQYKWSKTIKPKAKTLMLPKNLAMSKLNGYIEEGMMVKDVFKSNCTIKQMLDAFGFDKLLVN